MEAPRVDRTTLLQGIVAAGSGKGRAENEPVSPERRLHNLLPAPPLVQALDPLILLVLGGRGAGKSELFRALAAGSFEALSRGERTAPRPEPTPLLVFTELRDYPDPAEFAQTLHGANEVRLRCFWFGLLARRVLAQGQPIDLPEPVATVLKDPSARVGSWLPVVEGALPAVLTALDGLDTQLRNEGRWLFAWYDDLDRIHPTYAGLFAPLRQLLGLWLDRWRRWSRIRAKILLRNDIYESRLLAFPDASKLFSNHKVELVWKPAWLYRMWIKRLIHESEPLKRYVEQATEGKLRMPELPGLGLLPDNQSESFRKLIDAMVGPYMGSNPRKGATYDWITNHLQDAQGLAVPRSFVNLMRGAAERALERPDRTYDDPMRLLKPSDLHHALVRASNDRITELHEEDQWLDALKPALEGRHVPMEAQEMLELLSRIRWPQGAERQPPTMEPAELVENLIRRGVLERRTDGRLNVPDIYLYGFGLKRKGGPRRQEEVEDDW
jgi:hypothetical protein